MPRSVNGDEWGLRLEFAKLPVFRDAIMTYLVSGDRSHGATFITLKYNTKMKIFVKLNPMWVEFPEFLDVLFSNPLKPFAKTKTWMSERGFLRK